MNAFDVRIHTIRRRKNKRRPFEVRWRVAGRDKSKSFLTRALADSYRAELVRAARQGLEFDPATGEPLLWAVPGPAATTWLEHAVGYAGMNGRAWRRIRGPAWPTRWPPSPWRSPNRPLGGRRPARYAPRCIGTHSIQAEMLPGQIRLRLGRSLGWREPHCPSRSSATREPSALRWTR